MLPHLGISPRLVVLAAAALLAAGCGGGAAAASIPAPSATARPVFTNPPTPSPRPSVKPSPKPSPSPEPAARAIDALKIGSPYTLVYNPANPALDASFNFQVGNLTVTETMSGLEVRQRAKTVGLVYVLEITGIPMSNAVFEGGAKGAAANTGGKLTYGKVSGKKVAYIATTQASFAMYLHKDVIVMVGAQTMSQTKTLLTSVIKANG